MIKKIINIFRTDKEEIELKEGFDVSSVNISHLDEGKVNFAYDNGIATMEEINDVMKIISTRTTFLLSYLATLVAAFAIFLFQYPYPSDPVKYFALFDMMVISFAIITVISYLFLILRAAINLIIPSFGAPIYNEPKNIIAPEMLKNDITLIKLVETSLLQGRIDFNTKLQNKLAKYLKRYILATFIIPVVVLVAVLCIGTFTPVFYIIHDFLSWWIWT